jgi:ribose transport system ATP-binding protein
METLLKMINISKRFPGVQALNRVNFSVNKGEIHSLIGQNGAGKSTLVKILAGHYSSDEGEIEINGGRVEIGNPRLALNLGIAIVYQELSLLPNLTVAENIFLGKEPKKFGIIDKRTIENKTDELLVQFGMQGINPDIKIRKLPLAHRQLVEIAKALSHDPKILILDEPTASLADDDCERLFGLLSRLRKLGIAIIFISHRIKEIMTNCDRGTILMNGRVITTLNIKRTSEGELIKLMIGRELNEYYRQRRGAASEEKVVLECENLSADSKVKDVNFQIKKGEIVGITGLLGAGQNQIARVLFGLGQQVEGRVILNGRQIEISSPRDAIRFGIGLLTENRKEEGLFLDMVVKENITLPSLKFFKYASYFPFVNQKKELNSADDFAHKTNIVMHSIKQIMKTLSGGNQQKTILARWLLKNLQIFIFIEPTRGIDVGSRAEIYRYLDELSTYGKSIIVISTDTSEILGVSDRIFVMYKGELSHIFINPEVTEENLLAAIQGGVN